MGGPALSLPSPQRSESSWPPLAVEAVRQSWRRTASTHGWDAVECRLRSVWHSAGTGTAPPLPAAAVYHSHRYSVTQPTERLRLGWHQNNGTRREMPYRPNLNPLCISLRLAVKKFGRWIMQFFFKFKAGAVLCVRWSELAIHLECLNCISYLSDIHKFFVLLQEYFGFLCIIS